MESLVEESDRIHFSRFIGNRVPLVSMTEVLSRYKLLPSKIEGAEYGIADDSSFDQSRVVIPKIRFISIPVATVSSDVIPLTVRFLSGEIVMMLCPSFYKLFDTRQLVAPHVVSFDPKDMLLGFAQEIDSEFIFLDEKIPIHKLPNKTKSLDVTVVVKFYMPDVLLIDLLSRHQFYLQLRQDLSNSERLWLNVEDRVKAAGYAIIAEDIECGGFSTDANKLKSLVGWRVVEQCGSAKVEALLRSEVARLDTNMSKTSAELEFCKIVQNSDNYGKRYYRIYAHKDFEVQLSSLFVSLSLFGVTIEESNPTISADLSPTVVLHSFSWRQIARFSFAWHRLTMSIKQPGSPAMDNKHKPTNWVLHYYIRKKAIGNYLLQLAADLNRFQMSLLQTYRIDRVIFPRSSGGPLETFQSSTLPRTDVEGMAEQFLSSTMPRKCSSGTLDGSSPKMASPIFAYGSNAGGRSSAPPPASDLLTSSFANVPQQRSPRKNECRVPFVGLPVGLLNNTANKWLSLSDFRQNITSTALAGLDKGSNRQRSVERAQLVVTKADKSAVVDEQARCSNRHENQHATETDICYKDDNHIYDCAFSMVPVEKVVQGLPPQDCKAVLLQVSLQRDETGSIGFSLSLDPSTRHLVVRRIKPGGAAEKSGLIQLGDRLVKIGDYNLAGKDYEDCVALLRSLSFPVNLTFERPSQQEQSSIFAQSSSSSFDFDEEITEHFDQLSRQQEPDPFDQITSSEEIHCCSPATSAGVGVPAKKAVTPIERRLVDSVERMFSAAVKDGRAPIGGTIGDDLGLRHPSEDVVHEEMTYPTGSEYPRGEENPYAKTGDDFDEELIEKMLDALGETDEELGDTGEDSGEEMHTFTLDVTKVESLHAFGFRLAFSASCQQCVVTHVDKAQADLSGLTVNDIVVAVNGRPVGELDEEELNRVMTAERRLCLTLCSTVDKMATRQLQELQEQGAASYFQLHSDTPPQQLTAETEIVKVSVDKQPSEELGCSLYASGSEIFIGTVKPGSKLALCGVRPGDMCLLINNESVFGLPSEKVAAALRTAAGKITLTLSRRRSPLADGGGGLSTCDKRSNGSNGLEKLECGDAFRHLSRQLSPALRADLRRLSAIWKRFQIDDHHAEFARILAEARSCDEASSTICASLNARTVRLASSSFIVSDLPNQGSVGDFWQMVIDNDCKIMVILGGLLSEKEARSAPFLPTQGDEVFRISPRSGSASFSIRLLSQKVIMDDGGGLDNDAARSHRPKLTVSKFLLTTTSSEERPDRMFFLIYCSAILLPNNDNNSSNLDYISCAADALLLPYVLMPYSSTPCSPSSWLTSSLSLSMPLLVCSDLPTTSFPELLTSPASSPDQRGVYCVVSSILRSLLTTRNCRTQQTRNAVITASSISESAVALRRQHPSYLCCVEQLAGIYTTLAAAIVRLLSEDAFSY